MTAQHKLSVFLGLKPRFFLGRNTPRKLWPKVFVRNVWVRCLIGEAEGERQLGQACGILWFFMYIQLGLKLHVCMCIYNIHRCVCLTCTYHVHTIFYVLYDCHSLCSSVDVWWVLPGNPGWSDLFLGVIGKVVLAMGGPLIIKPIYTLNSGHLLGTFLSKGVLAGG